MPYLVYFDSNKVVKLDTPVIRPIYLENNDKLKLNYDTEFTPIIKMIVDSIQCYLPIISPRDCLVFLRDELTNDFNPIEWSLKWYGADIRPITENENDNLYQFQVIFDDLIENCKSGRQIKTEFDSAINDGVFSDLLNIFNLKSEQLCYKKVNIQENMRLILILTVYILIMKHFLVMLIYLKHLVKIFKKFY